MPENTVTAIQTGLTNYGTTILDYFVGLLPALAGLAAIFFVVKIVRKKVRA